MEGIPRSGAELASLVTAARARAMAVGWLATASVLGAIGVMALGLALLVWLASHLAAGLLGAVAAGAIVLAVVTARRSRARGAEAADALDRAWVSVADEVLRGRRRDMTAAQLAEAMHTNEEHAQALLAQLSVGGRVRTAVRDDAELAYRVEDGEALADEEAEEAGGPRLRAE
jgi:hypothetical protein